MVAAGTARDRWLRVGIALGSDSGSRTITRSGQISCPAPLCQSVGATGFEPATSGTQSRPSTRLRYAPKRDREYSSEAPRDKAEGAGAPLTDPRRRPAPHSARACGGSESLRANTARVHRLGHSPHRGPTSTRARLELAPGPEPTVCIRGRDGGGLRRAPHCPAAPIAICKTTQRTCAAGVPTGKPAQQRWEP